MSNIPNKLDISNLVTFSANNALIALDKILTKAHNHAKSKNIKEETILGLRIIADMLPFIAHVHIVTDNIKGAFARLSGIVAPVFEDNETTIEQLQNRILRTKEFIATIDTKLLENTENKEIILKFPSQTLEFVGYNYVLSFLIPNMNFHLATAYNILRANGVDLGKSDYLVK